MSSDDPCPHCGADMRGDPIPDELRQHYGDSTHWSRRIGVEIPNAYDGALFWQCPDCGGQWHRWAGDYLRAKAARYMTKGRGDAA
jgi:predicted RNA-binding Zn-ribbon protein involved in translation (DUF1610 family)